MTKFLHWTIIVFLTMFLVCLVNKEIPAKQEKIIRSVTIIRQDVFPEITRKPEFLYKWANNLHIVTKERVIRRELLFKEGDIYDHDILEESERKLRRLSYLGEVKIVKKNEDEQFVDVEVTTQDQWTTLISAIVSQGGNRTILGGALEEFNFLGNGKQIFAEIRHEISEGTQYTLKYTDPLLFGSRWTTEETFITGPFIKSLSSQLIRPFYSLDTKWAGGVSASTTDETVRLFEGGREISRLQLESDGFQILGARALGSRFNKTRLQLTYRFQNRDFTSLDELTATPVPDDELIHSLSTQLSFENVSFVKEKQIDKFLRTEDLTLGQTTTIAFGRTGIPIPKGVERFELSINRRQALQIFKKQYLFFSLGFQTLFEKDTIASLRLGYYNKLLARQTIALNLQFDYGENLEASRQFLLGGDSGLRGYEAREFTGDKRLLVNLENRIFSSLNILTVAFGGIVFFDAGNVWKESETVDLADLKYSVGLGLRLGYTKSPDSRVGRIDFGWPLNRGGGFGVSIGVDQQFSVN